MKKKTKMILAALIFSTVLSILAVFGIVKWMFSSQYNSNGVSHYLVVTIDESKTREYIGELDGYQIYMEKLNIEETNFRNVHAKNVSVKEAIDKKLVSIDEWKKYAFIINKSGNYEVLKFDNYEIACAPKVCIIRPLSK